MRASLIPATFKKIARNKDKDATETTEAKGTERATAMIDIVV
jgi:hypothetical protein